MTLKSLGYALVAGLAVFVGVGVAVTELASAWIEFSLFVGLPAGIIAGVATTAAVAFGLSQQASPRLARIAGGMVRFGAAFLLVAVSLGVLGSGIVLNIAVAIAVGLVAAVVIDRRG